MIIKSCLRGLYSKFINYSITQPKSFKEMIVETVDFEVNQLKK